MGSWHDLSVRHDVTVGTTLLLEVVGADGVGIDGMAAAVLTISQAQTFVVSHDKVWLIMSFVIFSAGTYNLEVSPLKSLMKI